MVNISNRFSVESGGIMVGGFETCGNAADWVNFSCTLARAANSDTPDLKIMTIRDRLVSDWERMVSTSWTPLRRSASKGTVTICSTSCADNPSASV
jgi:hypothetical protein